MNTIKILALTAMTAALTACSNDDEVISSYPSDNIVRITANVGEAATRASYNESNLKEFYICILTGNTNYKYDKVKVTKDPTTNTWKTASQMLWQNAQAPVTITAVTDNTNTCCHGNNVYEKVDTDQSSATDYRSDFLVYKKQGFVPETDLDKNGCIPITFSHLFSQLNINLTFGTEFNEGQTTGYLTANPITSIKVGGSIINAVCDFSASRITATTDTRFSAEDVTPHEVTGSFTEASDNSENAKVQYSCILVPQTIKAGDFSVTFTAGGKVYVWKSSADFTLESGHQHALNLTIGKDVVELGSVSITPWEDAATETLTTE